MTRSVVAVAAHADLTGIYWSDSNLVHEPQAFQKLAAMISADDFVPNLWVDMRQYKNADGSACFVTTGMSAFGLLEVEIDSLRGASQELADLGLGIVVYLLKKGDSIKEGETIGRSDQEKIKVTYGPSRLGRGMVMKLRV